MNGNGSDSSSQITVEELLQRIEAACLGMARTNPNRHLLEQCHVAIAYLVDKVPDEALRKRSPIIMP